MLGITPAHAGKRSKLAVYRFFLWDHPRTCGEKFFEMVKVAEMVGSPPHMRGKVFVWGNYTLQYRITPAHAGKRQREYIPATKTRDHPRTCGEKIIHLSI